VKKLLFLFVGGALLSSCTEIKMLQSDVASLNKKVDAMGGDADGDGVADYFDVEDDTPEGVQVAGNGAALDSDGDGVPNHLDQDPFTQKGIRVDANGIAIDTDKDGVPDGIDQENNTAAGAMVNFKGQTIGVANKLGGSAALLPSVYFKFGSSSLSPSAYEQLSVVARYLSDNPTVTITIRGYSDPVGSETYNNKLAMRRAQSVKKALNEVFKINGDRLLTVSIGENDELSDDYKINRRVDFAFN